MFIIDSTWFSGEVHLPQIVCLYVSEYFFQNQARSAIMLNVMSRSERASERADTSSAVSHATW